MAAEILALRVVHVVSGALWVGTAVFLAAFLVPSLGEIGPAAGQVMASLQRRRMMLFMPGVAVLTLLSGARLLWIDSGASGGAYFGSGPGMAFAIGGTAALLAFVIGMAVTRPAMDRASTLSTQIPTTAEADRPALMAQIGALRARGAKGGNVIALLVVIAAIAMSVARYL